MKILQINSRKNRIIKELREIQHQDYYSIRRLQSTNDFLHSENKRLKSDLEREDLLKIKHRYFELLKDLKTNIPDEN